MNKIDVHFIILAFIFLGFIISTGINLDRHHDIQAQFLNERAMYEVSVWGLNDALVIKQQALDDVIGDLNDCIEAKDDAKWIPQRSHIEFGVPKE